MNKSEGAILRQKLEKEVFSIGRKKPELMKSVIRILQMIGQFAEGMNQTVSKENSEFPEGSLNMKKIGRAIRTVRRRCDMTLKNLSDKIGVTESFLSMVENGRRAASVDNLNKIAEALSVPTTDFLKS